MMTKQKYRNNCYVCPTGEIIELKIVDKLGYKIYKPNKKSCERCK